MVKIFFNLVRRHFLKGGILNFLNIAGLALGMTAAVLIALYAEHEYTYDEFHPDANNIYRMEAKTNSDLWFSNLGAEHALELLSGKYPEVEDVLQLNSFQQSFLSYKGKRFSEKKIYQTDPGSRFFDFFNFEFVEGNPNGVLEEPYSVVITESVREKYFLDGQALGEVIEFGDKLIKVNGVIKDLPTNSHLDFELLYTDPQPFGNDHYHTNSYIKLVDDASPELLKDKILNMEGVALDEYHELTDVALIGLPDIYFDSASSFGSGGIGDRLQLTVFIVIGGLILLISVANYVNLSLAIYSGKGQEIGIRKVLGESKQHVMRTFVYESLIITALAVPLVLIGLKFTIPTFGDYLGINLENRLFTSPVYWIASILFIITVSFITVVYPISVLNNANISSLIKSKTAVHHSGGVKLRNVLLFIQFIVLFTLGISAWFMNRQINYLDSKDMGFDPTGVIRVQNAFNIGEFENYRTFKTELLKHPQIEAVAFGPMIGDGMTPLAYKPEGSDEIYENLLSYGVGIDYFDVMGMEVISGEFKNKILNSDSGQITSLVNQSFVNLYGWQDDPIGKKIILRPNTENELNREVSAVFKDFHFYTLKEKVTPQIISLRPYPRFVNTNILVRAAVPDMKQVTDIIENAWFKLKPDTPIEYNMMDDAVKQLYDQERQTSQVSLVFSLLAISLSLLGLIGFMIYIVGLRSKEIAVRKVLGATLTQIVGLLNKQLSIAIFIAAIIGSMLSYWLVSQWLNEYAYTITLRPETYFIALFLVYLIVFLITALQSLKSAHANPVLALKNE